jgi:hypothetical protein
MKSKSAQLVIRILGYIAKSGWIVVIIINLIDGEYFSAGGYFCFGLIVLFPQQFYKKFFGQ